MILTWFYQGQFPVRLDQGRRMEKPDFRVDSANPGRIFVKSADPVQKQFAEFIFQNMMLLSSWFMLKNAIRVEGWKMQLNRAGGWIAKMMRYDGERNEQGRRMDRKPQRALSQRRIFQIEKNFQSQAPLFRISKP